MARKTGTTGHPTAQAKDSSKANATNSDATHDPKTPTPKASRNLKDPNPDAQTPRPTCRPGPIADAGRGPASRTAESALDASPYPASAPFTSGRRERHSAKPLAAVPPAPTPSSAPTDPNSRPVATPAPATSCAAAPPAALPAPTAAAQPPAATPPKNWFENWPARCARQIRGDNGNIFILTRSPNSAELMPCEPHAATKALSYFLSKDPLIYMSTYATFAKAIKRRGLAISLEANVKESREAGMEFEARARSVLLRWKDAKLLGRKFSVDLADIPEPNQLELSCIARAIVDTTPKKEFDDLQWHVRLMSVRETLVCHAAAPLHAQLECEVDIFMACVPPPEHANLLQYAKREYEECAYQCFDVATDAVAVEDAPAEDVAVKDDAPEDAPACAPAAAPQRSAEILVGEVAAPASLWRHKLFQLARTRAALETLPAFKTRKPRVNYLLVLNGNGEEFNAEFNNIREFAAKHRETLPWIKDLLLVHDEAAPHPTIELRLMEKRLNAKIAGIDAEIKGVNANIDAKIKGVNANIDAKIKGVNDKINDINAKIDQVHQVMSQLLQQQRSPESSAN